MSKLLSQEEIDALMRAQAMGDSPAPVPDSETAADGGLPQEPAAAAAQPAGELPQMDLSLLMTPEEMDALGEIGNISMGSASTTLSELLSQRVSITSPRVKIMTKKELFDSFSVPYLVIKVDFSEGLNGYNLLVIRLQDAATMASLMMGGDGTPMSEEISDMEISAAAEAMNMMIGTAATSLSQMFHRPINISPPETNLLKSKEDPLAQPPQAIEDVIVVVSFDMKIGDLVDTDIMQIMSVETAREEANLLLKDIMGLPDTPSQTNFAEAPADPLPSSPGLPSSQELAEPAGRPVQPSSPPPAAAAAAPPPAAAAVQPAYQSSTLGSLEQRNLDLILDIPLRVSVVLGRTRRPIKDVLKMAPGSVVELDALADEPVEILVNGTLVATGEVVVVNENFGVRITNIISPLERVQRLGGKKF
ncbi:flagellar motor switch phosphatase FliY [Desulforamulus hydrothermalis]|uniref:Flagellar motor switch protein FliN n=1 Tax=Desulforamulus hydrothermalis Lam5 = DSM 18033 TaxID=1121428 RepID=K8E0Q5_9FIRM|nr:flagellar motor switch phosphatase FliY [Desulforamulus hydrothermalis]CCO09192.1 Flagellar motor switch protein FliN [Desulforamulus hydrothermalis Lam5 = DSM 18033]SHH10955.1 flagellar motor switch protein FliN/FliY [Desulforamulus hydrothermalis Lam5 = DSM 18033]